MSAEQQIEIDKIKERWAECAVTQKAKEQIRDAECIRQEHRLSHELREITKSREMIEQIGTPPLQNVSEAREVLALSTKGSCLSPYQLERVEKVLVAIERLRSYLHRGKAWDNPIAYYEEDLTNQQTLSEEIRSRIRNEAVDDHATRELWELRNRIHECEDQMKQKAEQIIRNNKDAMADSFYTLRNQRICVPVRKDHRYRIPGSVIDKSTTGSTFFIEPEAVARIFEELQMLKLDEENEELKILYTLSGMVAERAEEILCDLECMEHLDYIFSKGKFSIALQATEPKINSLRRIRLTNVRHPLMDPQTCVPLNFALGDGVRGIVITGPNTGGKTVAIKTVMVSCYMAQLGLHVAAEAADICMNSNYLCDIGDGQNLSENLSTFSAHIKNVLDVLARVNKFSFVILDELGSGTDPTEGMGIAIAILEELRKSECNFLVTTHYPEVKEYAERTEQVINARMTFDRETLQPTYQMVLGEAGESCAFYIADRLGMPGDMLKTAITAAYGEAAIGNYQLRNPGGLKKQAAEKLSIPAAKTVSAKIREKFRLGDSVYILPEKKIGIVCETVNEKGVLRIQVADRKIYRNHKRVKLHVPAAELYPENYDFSILFDSVADRKLRHDMERKFTEGEIRYDKETEAYTREKK